MNKHYTRVVYSALMGEYEQFQNHDYTVREDTRLVLFTDSASVKSDKWEVKRVEPRLAGDSIRSARYLKIMGPTLFPEAEQSLWLDNTVKLKVSPDDIMDAFLADGNDVAFPRHSFRSTVAAEFGAVQDEGADDFIRIFEQLFHYQSNAAHILTQKPLWTAIMPRRHTPDLIKFCTLWWEQVLRYSRRDQLSVNLALDLADVKFGVYDLDLWESPLHTWPTEVKRDLTKRNKATLQETFFDVPAARLAKAEYEHQKLLDILHQIAPQVMGRKSA